MKQQFIRQDGVVNGIDFDAHYSVKTYRGIAFYLLGYPARYDDNDDEEIETTDKVVAVMVGDDKRHVVDVDDLKVINEEEYCPSCGQIGCKHGRV